MTEHGLWLAVAFALASCGSADGVELVVDLRTDYVPGFEFTRARVELVEQTSLVVRRFDEVVSPDERFDTGARIGEFRGLGTGSHILSVVLMNGSEERAERRMIVRLEGSTGVVVLISRDCENVRCDEAIGGLLGTCVAGTCVSPECSPQDPDLCPPAECTANDASRCPTGAECSTPICADGVCLLDFDSARCEGDAWCSPTEGCVAMPVDAGSDAAVPADAGADAPSCGDCDDGNPCTDDTCEMGVCTSMPAADGTNCGPGQTCAAGICSCAGATAYDGCDDVDSDCDGQVDEDCGCDLAAPGELVFGTVATLGNVGVYSALKVDSEGGLHVAYQRADLADLEYAYHPPYGFWHQMQPPSVGTTHETSIAVDPSGGVHAVYYDATASDLVYAARPEGESEWQVVVVDSAGVVGLFPDVAVDSDGGVHVSYRDASNRSLKYAYRPPGGSFVRETVMHADNVGEYSSIAVDDAGGVHISYQNATSADLEYAFRPAGGSFTTEPVVTEGSVGQYTSIAVDDGGGVHIAYHAVTGRDLGYAHRPPGEPAFRSELVDTTNDQGRAASLALVDGVAHILYWDASVNDLKHAEGSWADWSVEVVDSERATANWVDLAAGPDGSLHGVLFNAATAELAYVYQAPASDRWQLEVVASRSNAGRYGSIAVDSQGRVHTFFSSQPTGQPRTTSRYGIKPAPGMWEVHPIASTNSTGHHANLDVGPNDEPLLVHFDATNTSLRLELSDGAGGFSSTELDADNDVGRYPSIVSLPSGEVLVAYYDNSAGDLKVAAAPNPTAPFSVEPFDTVGNVGWYTAMETDSRGAVHLAYYDLTNGDARYALRPPGGQLSDPVAVVTEGVIGQHMAMAIGPDDAVYLAYHHNMEGLGYSVRMPGAFWQSGYLIVDRRIGRFASIAVDNQSVIYGVAYDERPINMGASIRADLSFASGTPGDFNQRTIDAVGNTGTYGASAAIGPYVYTVYRNETAGDTLLVRRCP